MWSCFPPCVVTLFLMLLQLVQPESAIAPVERQPPVACKAF
jgi:hypothetical protein